MLSQESRCAMLERNEVETQAELQRLRSATQWRASEAADQIGSQEELFRWPPSAADPFSPTLSSIEFHAPHELSLSLQWKTSLLDKCYLYQWVRADPESCDERGKIRFGKPTYFLMFQTV
jgi:hypothetical protein